MESSINGPSDAIDVADLYRMPWTMSDNGFSWLEPTRRCNLSCEYCYQRNDAASDRTLDKIEADLDTLLRLRRCDTMIVAGGEPLIHPEIAGIVRAVATRGVKPVVLTNGHALSSALLSELKAAGAFGFVFHVDSGQRRPGWSGASECALNVLRQEFADRVASVGGLVCGFNTTILPERLQEVREVVRWTVRNADRVAANVLIPVRAAHPDDGWDYYAGAERLDVAATPYGGKRLYRSLTAADILREIHHVLPEYDFHSYLGGTVRADVPKWLFGTHFASRSRVHGGLGPRATELVQAVHHLFARRYLSFPSARTNRLAPLLSFPLALFDRGVRRAAWAFLRAAISRPRTLLEPVYLQNLIVMQPHDLLPNGEQDECDGCPNKTLWNGRLVSECRQEDYLLYGRPVVSTPKAAAPRGSAR